MADDRRLRTAAELDRVRAAAADAATLATAAGTMAIGLSAAANEFEHHHATPPHETVEHAAPPPILQQFASLFPPLQSDGPQSGHVALDPVPSSIDWHQPATPIHDGVAVDQADHQSDITNSSALDGGSAAVTLLEIADDSAAHTTAITAIAPDHSAGATGLASSNLPQSVLDIGAELRSITTSLSESIAALTQSVTGIVSQTLATTTGLLHDVLDIPAGLAGAMVSGLLGGAVAAEPTGHSDAVQLLDASGTVPVPFDHIPIQLGFLGQAHGDGQDIHDGAFSALGIHHF